MALHFDKQGLANEILNKLEIELNDFFNTWKEEVKSKMGNKEFRANAVIEAEIKRQSNMIVTYLKANTYVLADSYGTGSLMLSDNPGFRDYMLKGNINPARTGKAIMGRPAGTYTDIFGNEHTTSGTFKGINIEGRVVNQGKKGKIFKRKYTIEPVAPSKALQNAEMRLYKTYLPRAYKLAIRQVNFAKYLIES